MTGIIRVLTASKRDLGSLEQGFVDQLVEEMTSFLLGGHAWTVEHISHHDRTVQVRTAPAGKKPKWGGFLPQILSFELCQKVKHVLSSDESYPYLDPRASQALTAMREDMGDLLRSPACAIRVDDEGAHWWTFAGGRVNHTIKHALGVLADWKVVADNFQLRIDHEDLTHMSIEAAIRELGDSAFWRRPETHRELLARLPAYRLSKLQRALPDDLALEMVGAFLLDLAGAEAWCSIRWS